MQHDSEAIEHRSWHSSEKGENNVLSQTNITGKFTTVATFTGENLDNEVTDSWSRDWSAANKKQEVLRRWIGIILGTGVVLFFAIFFIAQSVESSDRKNSATHQHLRADKDQNRYFFLISLQN